MSLARRNCDGSDVYIYEHVDGYIECQDCPMGVPYSMCDDRQFTDMSSLIVHIAEHINAGHCVPDYVLPQAYEVFRGHNEI